MLSEGTSLLPPLTPQLLILVREPELPFYLRSAWKIKPIWLFDSYCLVLVVVSELLCFTGIKLMKGKEERRETLFRDLGIWKLKRQHL